MQLGRNDLATTNPELLNEWSSKNDRCPEEVRFNESYRAEWTCSTCNHEWKAAVANRAKSGHGCPQCHRSSKVSKGQQELFDFLVAKGFSATMNAMGFRNSREELDLYLPKLGLGIEYNGDYWHSDAVTTVRKKVSARDAHEAKLKLCHEHNIELVFVWESDWREKREQIEEALLSLLNGGTVPGMLNKMEGSIKGKDRELISTKANGLRARALTEEEKETIRTRYMAGESAAALSKELLVSKSYTFQFIESENLPAARETLGISKNGRRILPESRYEEFRRDWPSMKIQQLQKKYELNYKAVHLAASTLGLG